VCEEEVMGRENKGVFPTSTKVEEIETLGRRRATRENRESHRAVFLCAV
jgi:hypothetical protein